MRGEEFVKSSGNVFKEIGFNEVESRDLKFRLDLMSMLIRYIEYKRLSHKEAAQLLNVTQKQIGNLFCGKIDLFSNNKLGHKS